jgi:hypothetical protein
MPAAVVLEGTNLCDDAEGYEALLISVVEGFGHLDDCVVT